MAAGQRIEYEKLDTSLDATALQQEAAKHTTYAIACLTKANQLLERQAMEARREDRQARTR
jgi:hypothetical protein